MQTKKLSGKILFLHYAGPCASIKHVRGEISTCDYLELKGLISSGAEPHNALLHRCFPNAVHAYEQFVTNTRSELYAWSPESVADYWRNNHQPHGPSGKSDLWKIEIVSRLSTAIVVVKYIVREFPANIVPEYGLDIAPGKIGYVHQNTLIEVI